VVGGGTGTVTEKGQPQAKNGCQTTSDQAYFEWVTCWQENQQERKNYAQGKKRNIFK